MSMICVSRRLSGYMTRFYLVGVGPSSAAGFLSLTGLGGLGLTLRPDRRLIDTALITRSSFYEVAREAVVLRRVARRGLPAGSGDRLHSGPRPRPTPSRRRRHGPPWTRRESDRRAEGVRQGARRR